MEKSPETATREEVFDQSVEELKQLEDELERKPDNEKIKGYITEIKKLCERLLEEVDAKEQIDAVPRVSGAMGEQAVGMATSDFASRENELKHIDSQGLVYSDRKMAVNGDPNRENYSSSKREI